MQTDKVQEASISDYEIEVNNLKRSLNFINKRLEEYNDVKQAIRQMNDYTRDDIYTNIDHFANLLRQKLDEFCNVLKEKLKLKHKLINEKQQDLTKRVKDTLTEMDQKCKEVNDDETKNDKYKDVYLWALNKTNEIENEISNSNLNELYPRFNYSIDTELLNDAIDKLKFNLEEDNSLDELTIESFEKKFSKVLKITQNDVYDCIVTSGVDDYGKFWLELLTENNQIIHIIEEISNYIRFKRITDASWLTYQELNQVPNELNEKCFCLNHKTQKWMRAVIENYDANSKQCKIRYLDVNTRETGVSLKSLLKWKEFSLNEIGFQSVKSCLFITKFDKKFTFDTRFLFRDLTINKKFKCIFKEFVDNDVWLVDLYNFDEYNEAVGKNDGIESLVAVNKFVFDDYNKNSILPKTITSEDIRLSDNNPAIKLSYSVVSYSDNDFTNTMKISESTESLASSSVLKSSSDYIGNDSITDGNLFYSASMNENIAQLIKNISDIDALEESDSKKSNDDLVIISNVISDIISNIETENNGNLSSIKESKTIDNLYEIDAPVIDQDSEYEGRTGVCHITSDLNNDGIFWLSPKSTPAYELKIKALSKLIQKFIEETKAKSFKAMNQIPSVGTKCLFTIPNQQDNTIIDYKRGLIEHYYPETDKCRVRFLDRGLAATCLLHYIYPYVEFCDEMKINYKATRCCLFKNNNIRMNEAQKKKFVHFRSIRQIHTFMLIEKVIVGNNRCWYTVLLSPDGTPYNEIIAKIASNTEEQNITKKPIRSQFAITESAKQQGQYFYNNQSQDVRSTHERYMSQQRQQQESQLKQHFSHNKQQPQLQSQPQRQHQVQPQQNQTKQQTNPYNNKLPTKQPTKQQYTDYHNYQDPVEKDECFDCYECSQKRFVQQPKQMQEKQLQWRDDNNNTNKINEMVNESAQKTGKSKKKKSKKKSRSRSQNDAQSLNTNQNRNEMHIDDSFLPQFEQEPEYSVFDEDSTFCQKCHGNFDYNHNQQNFSRNKQNFQSTNYRSNLLQTLSTSHDSFDNFDQCQKPQKPHQYQNYHQKQYQPQNQHHHQRQYSPIRHQHQHQQQYQNKQQQSFNQQQDYQNQDRNRSRQPYKNQTHRHESQDSYQPQLQRDQQFHQHQYHHTHQQHDNHEPNCSLKFKQHQYHNHQQQNNPQQHQKQEQPSRHSENRNPRHKSLESRDHSSQHHYPQQPKQHPHQQQQPTLKPHKNQQQQASNQYQPPQPEPQQQPPQRQPHHHDVKKYISRYIISSRK